MIKKKLVVLSGAGISAESGIKTFRDADGLWEGHDIMEVASPQGWNANQELVLDFYNKRRQQLQRVKPNNAHRAIASLEPYFDVAIITQNVDNLHEVAGSKNVTHLHGELLKVRSTKNKELVYDWARDLNTGDLCENKHQLRPHIVWFGEDVPLLEKAALLVAEADIIIIVGTSMQVYPAASLIHYAKNEASTYFVDPKPSINTNEHPDLIVFAEKATIGIPSAIEHIKQQLL